MLGLIITRGDEIGGAQTHLLSIAKSLKDDGLDFIVFVGTQGIFSEILKEHGIKVINLKYLVRNISIKNDIFSIFELFYAIKKYKITTLNAHSTKAGLVSRVAGIFSGVKVIFTVHGWAFADGISESKRKLYSMVERFLARYTYRFINVSKADYLLAREYNIGSEQQHTVIHNGIEDLSQQVVNTEISEGNNIKFVMVARFCDQKDHSTIINALAKLERSNWEMSFVGSGCYDKYVKMADELGVLSKIKFLGERRDINNLLAASDIFILCSNWEGFPISIIEAMRASKLVLASNVGGVKEAVEPEFLLERGDIQSWVQKLNFILANPQVVLLNGNKNRIKFMTEFNVTVMYSKYKNVIFER